MNFTTILTFINILTMGAVGIGFIYNKTDAAKFNPSQLERDIAANNTKDAVQDNDIQTLKTDVKEIKMDVKMILKTLRPDDYRPAAKDASVPLVKSVAPSGEPSNE